MRKLVVSLSLVGLLAGCADPLAEIPKFADANLQEDSVQADALAAPVDTSDTRPLFQRLLGKKDLPAEKPTPEIEQDQSLVDGAGTVDGEPVSGEDVSAAVESGASEAVTAAEQDAEGESAVAGLATTPQVQAAPAPADKSKLFGFLKPKPQNESRAPTLADKKRQADAESAEVLQASLTVEPEANPVVTTEKERGAFKGLFSQRKAARLTGPDATLIEPGTALPYGVIARVCKLKRSEMGREVERSSDGKGKFRLYDSAPGNTAMHAYYITGFDDGCPRQVSAALAVFGDVARHEFLRYGPASKGQPWSETDASYEQIKRKVCKVGKGKPCGNNLTKLEKSTSFLTVYNSFVGAASWRNILLHDGSVVAMN